MLDGCIRSGTVVSLHTEPELDPHRDSNPMSLLKQWSRVSRSVRRGDQPRCGIKHGLKTAQ